MSKPEEARTLNRLLFIVLALAILGAAAAFIYFIASPPAEKSTEFYLLGIEGKATNYPEKLKLGEEASLTLGIINREQTSVSYRVEVSMNGVIIGNLAPMTLGADEKLEREITFSPNRLGENQKVEFFLYKQGQSEAYESLYLMVDVTN
jgi:uncharacterized membrane protein